MNNTGTLTKILNSINNTLNIANKVMPIYKESKPIINTIKKTYANFKNNKTDIKKIINLVKIKNQLKKDNNISNTIENNTTYNNINNPKFFI